MVGRDRLTLVGHMDVKRAALLVGGRQRVTGFVEQSHAPLIRHGFEVAAQLRHGVLRRNRLVHQHRVRPLDPRQKQQIARFSAADAGAARRYRQSGRWMYALAANRAG